MAGIISNVDSDVQKLRKLKNEIEEVKKALKSINITVDIDIAKGLQSQLTSLLGQYDALVDKIAAAEGKIMLSTKRINEAAEKIIKAQEKVSKSVGIPTQTGRGTEINMAETANIQAQAKAYEDLKDEINTILGTREDNVKRMVDEMNAIRLINAEIKKITKSQGELSSLSSAQQKRLEQLNNSLLTHKTALSEVRQTLNNNVKLNNVAATSMNGLSQSLSRMRIAYRELTEEERNSSVGKELLASINQADAKIKELDATIGNHQRNVGNYSKQWDGLSMSIQQVGRELPSLAYGPKVFFSAISNNLPILADEIKRARKEYDLLKKSGQSATPVWKQVVSSLFSWQSALTVGITLLTLYGDKVIDWAGSLFTAKKELSETYQSLEDFQKKVGSTSSPVIATLEHLSQGWKKLGGDVDAQKKFILDNKDAIDSMGVCVNDAAEAERLFNSNKDTFILGILQRAKAAATMELAAEEYKKAIQKMMEADAKSAEGVSFGDKFKSWFAKSAATEDTSGYLLNADLSPETFAKEKEEKLRKEAESLFKSGTEFVQKYAQFSEEERKTLESIGIKATQTMIEGSVEAIEAAISLKQQSLKKVTDPKEYKHIEAEIMVEQAKLKAITGDKNNQNQAEKLRKEQEKYKVLLDKQKLEQIRANEDLQMQADEAHIKAMDEGSEKIIAQMELDNKKEIQALQRQKDDYIRNIIQSEREKFEAEEDVKAAKDKNYKKKTFNPSSVSVDTSSFDGIISDTIARQGKDKINVQNQAMSRYLKEYGTFQQKKEAITKEYTDKIANVTTEGDKKILQKEMEELISSLDMEKLKQEINWELIFGDLSKVSKKSLEQVKKQLKEFKNSDEYKNMTVDQKKIIDESLNNIQTSIIDKGGLLGDLPEQLDALRIAQDELKKAQDEYNDAIKNGTDAEKEAVFKKKNNAEKNVQNAETNVTKSADKTKQNLITLADTITQLGSSSEMSLSQIGNLAGGVVDIFTEAGSKIGGIVGAVFSILDGIQQQGFDKFVGNILESVAGAALNVVTFGFVKLGADYSHYNEMVAQYENINSIWDELIDKKLEYIEISYGSEAVKAGKEAEELERKAIENYRNLGIERLNSGASAGSHAIGVRIREGMPSEGWEEAKKALGQDFYTHGINDGRMTGLFGLTAKQLEKLKSEAPVFWANLDSDVRDYLDNIIEGEEKIEEIQNKVKEQLTQTTFDEVFDNFMNTLLDMDSAAKDFADDFEEYMRRAIITNIMGPEVHKKIEEWYKNFSKDMEEKLDDNGKVIEEAGVLTDKELADRKEEWNKIVQWGIAERDAVFSAMGWDSSSSQSATTKGFQTMSQDTGEELNGRFTALQIAGEEIRNQNIAQSQSLNLLTAKADTILSVNTETRNIADDTRDLIAQSYLELVQISENTGAIVKPIQQIQKDIAEVKKNTSKL